MRVLFARLRRGIPSAALSVSYSISYNYGKHSTERPAAYCCFTIVLNFLAGIFVNILWGGKKWLLLLRPRYVKVGCSSRSSNFTQGQELYFAPQTGGTDTYT
jgi:hypothetical protein